MAHKNACAILLKRILHHSQSIDSEDIICTERLCLALSSILLYRANHERMNGMNHYSVGYVELIEGHSHSSRQWFARCRQALQTDLRANSS